MRSRFLHPLAAVRFIGLYSAILFVAALLLSPLVAKASVYANPVGRMSAASSPAQKSRSAVTILLHRHVVRVTISNFAFKPARIVVSPGTRIVWTNRDSDPHTVTSDAGLWTSGALDTAGQFSRAFPQGGTVHYHCTIHPFMHGTITVKK